MLASALTLVSAFSPPHPDLLRASSQLVATGSQGGGEALVNGLALATFAGLGTLQTAVPQMAAFPSTQVAQPPSIRTDQDEEGYDTCYPVGYEECEACEYNEEFSAYYGQPVWLCTSEHS